MATPNAQNTHAAKQTPAAQNVATPNPTGAFSSPAPRSVPSPAVRRTAQAGKSPFNPSGQSASAALNHPTGSSAGDASKTARTGLLGSSPALNLDSPSLMGHDMTAGISNMGAIGMDKLFSGLGVNAANIGLGTGNIGTARASNDEAMYAYIRQIRDTYFQDDLGRIGQEGLERAAKKYDLDKVVETNVLDGKTAVKLSLAGQHDLLIDIVLEDDYVKKVEIEAPEIWKSASNTLLGTLTARDRFQLMNKKLYDGFAPNLEVLARMDKLSSPSVNCFSAVSGIHASLQKLFAREVEAQRNNLSNAKGEEIKLERQVLCKHSGRPGMHIQGNVGLSLEYWMFNRHDTRTPPPGIKPYVPYSLQIQCEVDHTGLYTPVRVSDDWHNISTEPRDWQWNEPPLPVTGEDPTDELSLAGAPAVRSKSPPIRFMAKLTPPVVVPIKVASDVFAALGAVPQEDASAVKPYEGMVIGHSTIADDITPGRKEIRAETVCTSMPAKAQAQAQGQHQRMHESTLYLPKVEHGFLLRQIPFAHPKQLISLLPALRQHALLNRLLQKSFPKKQGPVKKVIQEGMDRNPLPPLVWHLTRDTLVPNPRFTLSIVPHGKAVSRETSFLDSLLNDTPMPAEEMTAPNPPEEVQITFDVLPNSEVEIVYQNVLDPADTERIPRLGKALDAAGDMNIWAEFLHSQWMKTHASS